MSDEDPNCYPSILHDNGNYQTQKEGFLASGNFNQRESQPRFAFRLIGMCPLTE